MKIFSKTEGPFLAGDCPLPGHDERQLTRKLLLKPTESAAIGDPKRTPHRGMKHRLFGF